MGCDWVYVKGYDLLLVQTNRWAYGSECAKVYVTLYDLVYEKDLVCD